MEKGRLAEHIRKRAVCPRLGYENCLHDKEAGAGRETAFFSLREFSGENMDIEVQKAYEDNTKFAAAQEILAAVDKETFAELLITSISNQLLSSLASPIGIMAEILLPAGYTEKELRYMMEKLSLAAKGHCMDLAAVDIHCTDSVNVPVVAAWGVGRKSMKIKDFHIPLVRDGTLRMPQSLSDESREGAVMEEEKKESADVCKLKKKNAALYEIKKNPESYSIIMAGLCGVLGTRLLYQQKKLRQGFSEGFLKKAEEIFKDFSVKEAIDAVLESTNGAVYMKPGGETGFFGALWDLSEDLKTGFRVELERIPIRQETIEFCEKENISPYEINAMGCILAVTDRPGPVLEALLEKEIPAANIGYLSGKKEKCILGEKLPGEEREIRFLDSPRPGKREEHN